MSGSSRPNMLGDGREKLCLTALNLPVTEVDHKACRDGD